MGWPCGPVQGVQDVTMTVCVCPQLCIKVGTVNIDVLVNIDSQPKHNIMMMLILVPGQRLIWHFP